MDANEIMKIYDRLCMALTCYETCAENEHDPDYDPCVALYNDIVDIVNEMAKKLN